MRYANKIPFNEQLKDPNIGYLYSLQEEMAKIMKDQSLQPDAKVKLYNQVLERMMINLPEQSSVISKNTLAGLNVVDFKQLEPQVAKVKLPKYEENPNVTKRRTNTRRVMMPVQDSTALNTNNATATTTSTGQHLPHTEGLQNTLNLEVPDNVAKTLPTQVVETVTYNAQPKITKNKINMDRLNPKDTIYLGMRSAKEIIRENQKKEVEKKKKASQNANRNISNDVNETLNNTMVMQDEEGVKYGDLLKKGWIDRNNSNYIEQTRRLYQQGII